MVSLGSEEADRGPKREAYGLMGVGWLWLPDPHRRTVETFVNVRGSFLPEVSAGPGGTVQAPPFETIAIEPDRLFLA